MYMMLMSHGGEPPHPLLKHNRRAANVLAADCHGGEPPHPLLKLYAFYYVQAVREGHGGEPPPPSIEALLILAVKLLIGTVTVGNPPTLY